MDPITQQVVLASAGAAGAGEGLYVDEVFSTFVYEGNGSARTIANGIDLSGEGGLVWIKNRKESWSHYLFDTERSPTNSSVMYYLRSDSTSSQSGTNADSTKDFGGWASNGFLLGEPYSMGAQAFNGTDNDYVSWTFRKATQFFDIVTYNGTGSVQNISHALGSVPGMIIIHCLDGSHDWEVYHRETGATKSLHLNTTDAAATDSTVWNDTTPTSSVFTVGTSNNVNQNGHEYVAYIFAHDEQAYGTNSNEAIIKCGSYTGNGSTPGVTQDLGFEPQFLLIKNTSYTDATSNWMMFDMMRGLTVQPIANTQALTANLSTPEGGNYVGDGNTWAHPTPTGFMPGNSANAVNRNGDTMIYMAIRRPHKPPTAGTGVFTAKLWTGNGSSGTRTITGVGFTPDLVFGDRRSSGGGPAFYDRLRGKGNYLQSDTTQAAGNTQTEGGLGQASFDVDGSYGQWNNNGLSYVGWLMRRAVGFMDVVNYTGNGSQQTISHNLNSIPEMMIVKDRSRAEDWMIYHHSLNSAYGTSYPANELGQRLNANSSTSRYVDIWNSTSPTSSVFSVGNSSNTNHSGDYYVAYLFDSLDDISKVGSYTGTGYDVNVDCGFSSGARFILIKRADDSGDWYVWDSTRGIVSGNDPYLLLNSTAAEVTNTDYIDPLTAGFTVTSSAPAALNTSGGTYLFLAIA